MKYRQRMKLHTQHKKTVEQQIDSSLQSLPPPPPPATPIVTQERPPLLRLLDPENKGIFAPRPVLTFTLQDYFGDTNVSLQLPAEGMQAIDVIRMILQQHRQPHEVLPAHYYRMLHVFTPHCEYCLLVHGLSGNKEED